MIAFPANPRALIKVIAARSNALSVNARHPTAELS